MSDVIKAYLVAEKDCLDFLPRYFMPRCSLMTYFWKWFIGFLAACRGSA